MLRTTLASAFLLSLFPILGCNSEPPAEATGEPVAPTYEHDQQAAQQKAMEEAMKNQGR